MTVHSDSQCSAMSKSFFTNHGQLFLNLKKKFRTKYENEDMIELLVWFNSLSWMNCFFCWCEFGCAIMFCFHKQRFPLPPVPIRTGRPSSRPPTTLEKDVPAAEPEAPGLYSSFDSAAAE